VGSYASVTNQGGRLKLLNAQKRVDDVLQITKLYTVFEAFTDEGDAVASFGTAAATPSRA
jgi:anti-sigma B factor antagonist